MIGNDIYRMMRRRAKEAQLTTGASPHSFRVAVASDLHDQGVRTDFSLKARDDDTRQVIMLHYHGVPEYVEPNRYAVSQ